MTLNIKNHPCFNDSSRHTFGRIHLPVAPKCNIQCNYCSRKFDCMNENRPGVTSKVLSPRQALYYLQQAMEISPNIAVVGIAGPGDPFANPDETMETLRLVREHYPEMLLCVATNGLDLMPWIDELAELQVSHVTITINAIDPEVGSEIYAWVRHKKKMYRDIEAAKLLIGNQLEALKRLKEVGVTAKVNSIIIPGINDGHVIDVAR
ncbi:MAG: radical SAM protein, partial [Chlorobium limicola]|nr:radical SAM protein [Chlorobium limicola]